MDQAASKLARHRAAVSAGVGLLFLAGIYLIWSPGSPESSPANPIRANTATSAAAVGGTEGKPTPPAVAGSSPAADHRGAQDSSLPFSKSPHYPSALAVAGMDEDETRVEAIEALMETWVAANPRQAADWAGSLPAGSFRDDALSSLMVHWAALAPEAAAAWMTRTGVDDGEAASVLASSWASQNPSAAAAWAAALGNLESRRLATSSVAGAWAATAPQAAADYAEALPPNDRSPAITSVLAVWAASAPAQAGGWLNATTFPTENDRAVAVAALITSWTTRSPAAASKYINTLADGPAREAAASQFAVTAAPTAPAEALMWGMNLADADQRNQVVADACESWLDGSPDTFRSGIAEAISLMEDPLMRRGVYEMLYERDPAFHDNLLALADPAATAATPAPHTPAPAAPAVPSPELPLLSPPLPTLPEP